MTMGGFNLLSTVCLSDVIVLLYQYILLHQQGPGICIFVETNEFEKLTLNKETYNKIKAIHREQILEVCHSTDHTPER